VTTIDLVMNFFRINTNKSRLIEKKYHSAFHFILPLIIILVQTGCSVPHPIDPNLATIDDSHLPEPDLSIDIPGLSACTTTANTTLHINTKAPLNIIVHGCYGSAARFRALAQVFAFHGQQTVCFNYNDRDSLMKSSGELIDALRLLSAKMTNIKFTVIGHSQGGLIARKALVKEREDSWQAGNLSLQLVTISSPFAGISAANHCVSPTARVLSLGLVVPICKLISGDKWYEITYSSDFIQKPGKLLEQVRRHVKIVTDETDSCRNINESGTCIEDDFVFTLNEQYFDHIDGSSRVKNIQVIAGHAEIVGDYRIPPDKLINLMQLNGIMSSTSDARREKFSELLSLLYMN